MGRGEARPKSEVSGRTNGSRAHLRAASASQRQSGAPGAARSQAAVARMTVLNAPMDVDNIVGRQRQHAKSDKGNTPERF